jgi:flagellar biogenesis protein FliO
VKTLLLILAMLMPLAFGSIARADSTAPSAQAAVPANAIPYKKTDAGTGATAGKSFSILAVLVGLACAGLFVLRRYFPQLPMGLKMPLKAGAPRKLTLVESMRLGPKASLYLVQLEGRTLLLGQSGDSITVVANGGADDGSNAREAVHHG